MVEIENISKIIEQSVNDYVVKDAMNLDDIVTKVNEKLAGK